jgi:hypothetical protein
MNGLCTGDVNPDLWFSNTVNNAVRALTICSYCPAVVECKAEGMKPDNIDYGVWGGSLAGERLLEAGEPISNEHRTIAVAFAIKVRERVSL